MSMVTASRIVGASFAKSTRYIQDSLEPRFRRRLSLLGMSSPPKVLSTEELWLRLSREPDNPADENAVAVYDGGVKLGYIPRHDAVSVARVMDSGMVVRCKYMGTHKLELSWTASSPDGLDAAFEYAIL